MQSRLGEMWAAIGNQLGVRVIAPFQCELPGGASFVADALVCAFGGQRGMLIIDRYDRVSSMMEDLVTAGYGCSVMASPGDDEHMDPEVAKLMLRDWGWHGASADGPAWYSDREPKR